MYQAVWELTGYSHNSNDQWEIGRVQVVPFTSKYCTLYMYTVQVTNATQVGFEAVRGGFGAGHGGYVALDGIFFDDSGLLPSCKLLPAEADPAGPATTSPAPSPGLTDCNFEDDECGWEGAGAGEFLWSRTQGDLHDGSSGPHTDHDGSGASESIFFA